MKEGGNTRAVSANSGVAQSEFSVSLAIPSKWSKQGQSEVAIETLETDSEKN